MAYLFKGFFSDGDEKVAAAAHSRWASCTVKPITTPFRGFGLKIPEVRGIFAEGEYEHHLESVADVEEGMVAFSRDFPRSVFVYLEADCFGGVCIYTGYVAQAGKVGLRISSDPEQEGTEPLQQLLTALGIDLGDGYFAPLTRGYWPVDSA